MILTKKGANEKTISIEENFRAPKDKVFKAWTHPESLKKWFMADEGVVVKDAEVNLEVGGLYFIETIFPDYDPSKIEGKFLKVKVPESLKYTWLTPVLNGKTTKVEVDFVEQERGSKIYLNHGEFETNEEMQLHITGWTNCIGKLQEFLGEG